MKFTRGDTFEFSGPVTAKVNGLTVTDLTGWSAKSQVRSERGDLLDDLVVTFLSYSPAAINLASSKSTEDWPVGTAKIDIEFTNPAGKIVSTQVVSFTVTQDVTRGG